MLNINPCGFGGNSSTDLRGGGLFLLPCYGPALSQTGRCDPQTSGAQIQKVIDSAVNMVALQARWPTVWAKAQLLLNLAGIEDYCRKPFGGPTGTIPRWQDNCACAPAPMCHGVIRSRRTQTVPFRTSKDVSGSCSNSQDRFKGDVLSKLV